MLLPITEAADLTFALPCYSLARLHAALATAYANRQTVINVRWNEREWAELKLSTDEWRKAVSVWLQLAAATAPCPGGAPTRTSEKEPEEADEEEEQPSEEQSSQGDEEHPESTVDLKGRKEEDIPLSMALMELARLSAACTVPLTVGCPFKAEKKLTMDELFAAKRGGRGHLEVPTSAHNASALDRQGEHALAEAVRILGQHCHPLLAKAYELQGAIARTKYRTAREAAEAAEADDANSFAKPVMIVRECTGSNGGEVGGDAIARATRGLQHGHHGSNALAAYLAGAHGLVELVRASHADAINTATSMTRRRKRYPAGRPTTSAVMATKRSLAAEYSPSATPTNPDAAAAAAASFVYDIGAMGEEEWRWPKEWQEHNWRDYYARCLEGAAAVYSDRGFDEVAVALLVTATIALEPVGAEGAYCFSVEGSPVKKSTTSKRRSPTRANRPARVADADGPAVVPTVSSPAGRRQGRRGSIFAEGVEAADGTITINSPGPRKPAAGTEGTGMLSTGGRPRGSLAAALRRLGREGEALFVEAGHRLVPVPIPDTTPPPVLNARQRAALATAKKRKKESASGALKPVSKKEAAAAVARKKRQHGKKILKPPPIQVKTNQVVEGASRFLGSRRASSPV
jgi:hypothetical protein